MVPTVNCWQVLPQKQNHQGFRLVTSCSTTRTDRPKAGVPEDKDMLGAAWRVVVIWVWLLRLVPGCVWYHGGLTMGWFFPTDEVGWSQDEPSIPGGKGGKKGGGSAPTGQELRCCSEGWMGMEQFFLFQSLKPKDFLVNGNSRNSVFWDWKLVRECWGPKSSDFFVMSSNQAIRRSYGQIGADVVEGSDDSQQAVVRDCTSGQPNRKRSYLKFFLNILNDDLMAQDLEDLWRWFSVRWFHMMETYSRWISEGVQTRTRGIAAGLISAFLRVPATEDSAGTFIQCVAKKRWQ